MNAEQLRDIVIDAFVEVSCDLRGLEAEMRKTNTLSAMGNLVSKAVRRRVLLAVAEEYQWRLTEMARPLGLYSCSEVLRYVKELAPAEYEAARVDGRIVRGGATRRRATAGEKVAR